MPGYGAYLEKRQQGQAAQLQGKQPTKGIRIARRTEYTTAIRLTTAMELGMTSGISFRA